MKKQFACLLLSIALVAGTTQVNAQLSFDWFAQNNNAVNTKRMQLDGSGNVYALENLGASGILLKYDTTGQISWSVNYALTPTSENDKLIVDGGGNAYVAYYGTCDPNCNRTIGHLKKFNPNGLLLWDDTLSGQYGALDGQIGLAIDLSGNLLLGITSIVTQPPLPLYVVEVAKYDFNGVQQWKLTSVYPTTLYPGILKALTCDQFGNVYIGYLSSVTDKFNLLKFNGNCFYQFEKIIDPVTAIYSQIDAVYDQASSSIFCTYNRSGGIVDSIFLSRVDPVNNGNILWTQKKSNNGFQTKIQIDGVGNVYWLYNNGLYRYDKYNATGTFQFTIPAHAGNLAFDNSDNIYDSGTDGIFKYSNMGNLIWSFYDNNSSAGNTGSPTLFNNNTNNIYFVGRDQTLNYGLARYSICNCNYTSTTTITNNTSAICNSGKIKVKLSGSFTYYPHIELYDANGTLLSSVNKPPTATSHTFSSLTSGKYTVKVYDKTCCEQDFSVQVKCAKPSAGLITSNITATSARANWTIMPCAAGYKLQFRKQGNSTWINKFVTSNTGFKSLTGLLPATTYEWRVQTNCLNSTPVVYSLFSTIQSFTTLLMKSGIECEAFSLPEKFELNIYPNPANDKLSVIFETANKIAELEVFNALGQKVFSKMSLSENESINEELDISALKNGIYLLIVKNEDGVSQKRFVKN